MTSPESRPSEEGEPIVDEAWAMLWVGPADAAGRHPTHPVMRDMEAVRLLAECGDGSLDRPWKQDALVALAKRLRQSPEIVHDQREPNRA